MSEIRELLHKLIALYQERPAGTVVAAAMVGGIVGGLLVSTLSPFSLAANIGIVLGCVAAGPVAVLAVA